MTTLETIQALAMQGISRKGVQATIGHKFDETEATAYEKANAMRQLRERQAAAKREKAAPKSTAQRVREYNERKNELGELPAVRHRRLKERCRYDLEAFGWYYCRSLLNHRASSEIRDGLIREAQNCILNGGLIADLYGRGGGKTTWIDEIAAIWALLYGHRRYPVLIAASLKAAKKILKTIKKILIRSNEIAADFPAIALPIRALGGISQRAAAQTFMGQPTDIEWGSDQITLPTLRDANGNLLDRGCGAILATTGKGGAIRGSNESGQRPDFLLIDDPQTKKDAQSPKIVEDIIEYIHSDALGLAGHNATMSAFLTITPQNFGDVATAIAKRPEWSVKVQPFIKQTCPNWERLVAEFCEKYNEDAAHHDFSRSRSRAWYIANREKFAEVKTIDPKQFDESAEVDVTHHMLNLRAKMGERSFNAEIMMDVSDKSASIEINPDKVAAALNGTQRLVLPPGTDRVVGFVDVNQKKGAGLTYVLCAFGANRVSGVIDYGRFPANGAPLVPPNSTQDLQEKLVASAIRYVIKLIASKRITDMQGRPVPITALGFDRGWLPAVVCRTLFVNQQTRAVPFPLNAVRGFPWNKFGTRQSDIMRRDSSGYVFYTQSQKYGPYIAQMSSYWRWVAQSALMGTPLMPGSLSLFGNDPAEHFIFANEICAEKLIRGPYAVYHGNETTMAWDWLTTSEHNHFMDGVSGCFALASWYHAYAPVSLSIDEAALGHVSRDVVIATGDLFDPRLNPEIIKNAQSDAGGSQFTQAAYMAKGQRPQGSGLKPRRLQISKSQIWWKK